MPEPSTAPLPQNPTILGHPRGLFVLFGAEMWERFSYYGMRALLVLYLTKHLKFERSDALEVYGIYTGLVYLTPLLGGYLADLCLGQRKAVLIGGILMALGHFAMAFEPLLNYALGLLILGNGFFKPNISTMVGQLYAPKDTRRDAGYNIFYMGINTGAGLAPMICGSLGEYVGWHYGFAAAGVGMVFGLVMFWSLQFVLGPVGFPLGRTVDPLAPRLKPIDLVHVFLIAAVGVGLVYFALSPWTASLRAMGKLQTLAFWTVVSLTLIPVAWLVTLRSRKADAAAPLFDPVDLGATDHDFRLAAPSSKEDHKAPLSAADWSRIAVILVVAMFSIIFWMAFEQAGGTLTLFADQKTRLEVFGFKFKASLYQAVNPWLIVTIAASFIWLWSKVKINSAAKLGVGLVVVGLSFAVMNRADALTARSPDGKVGPEWLAYVYLFNTIGELCLSPIGLSLVNRLAPVKVASLMMASWFFCTAAGNYLAAVMEKVTKDHHMPFWLTLVYAAAIPGAVLVALSPLLNKLSGNRLS